jgi:hypothetical protein
MLEADIRALLRGLDSHGRCARKQLRHGCPWLRRSPGSRCITVAGGHHDAIAKRTDDNA